MRDPDAVKRAIEIRRPEIEEIREPIITTTVFVPQDYLGAVITLCEQKRGAQAEYAPSVDVVVHNMRVAAIERLGLGPAACLAINPRLVYAVATGFGEDGPDAGKPAFDDVIQAACGLAALIGHEDGEPAYVPSLIADKTTGLALANAVLAALFHRERSGEGQHVEVPMLETMTAFTLAEHLAGLLGQAVPVVPVLCLPGWQVSDASCGESGAVRVIDPNAEPRFLDVDQLAPLDPAFRVRIIEAIHGLYRKLAI